MADLKSVKCDALLAFTLRIVSQKQLQVFGVGLHPIFSPSTVNEHNFYCLLQEKFPAASQNQLQVFWIIKSTRSHIQC